MKFIDRLLHNLSDMMKNGGTQWSSMRVAFTYAHFLSTTLILGLWFGLSIASGQLLPIDSSIIILYGTMTGLGYGGKISQKYLEKKNNINTSINDH